jgi:hypothetical protein
MEAAIIGLAGVLIGVAISTGASFWLEIRQEATETKNWRRERCLEAYTDILRACAIVMDEADNIYHMEPSAERVAQGKLLFEKVAEMYRLSDRVTLLGPREIHAPVDVLTRYYGTDIAARAHKAPKPSDDEWRGIRLGAAPLYMKFMMQARNDLGIHGPVHSLQEWMELTVKRNG